jgi:hypothetical protein
MKVVLTSKKFEKRCPRRRKRLSFCFDVVRIVKMASVSIFKLDVRIRVASYKLISLFDDENIWSACSDFGSAIEVDIVFVNLDVRFHI